MSVLGRSRAARPRSGCGRTSGATAAAVLAALLAGGASATAATSTPTTARKPAATTKPAVTAKRVATTEPKATPTTRAAATTRPAAATTAPPRSTVAAVAPRPTVRSGRITVYSGRTERLVKPLLDRFTFATGIELDVRYADSSQLAATLLEEGDRTRASVFFSQDAGALGALAKAGRLATLPDRVLDRVDRSYRAANGSWVGLSGRARVFVYDPRQVGTPPSTIAELTQPRWRNRIGYAPTNASWHAFVTALRVSLGEQGARRWLTDFRATSPRAYASNGAIVQAVNQGEISLGLVNHYYLYERMAADGASNVAARNAFPDAGDPGALVNVAGVAILSKAADDAAALELVDFLLSKDAQEYFAEKTFEYPLVNGVPHHPTLPSLRALRGPDVDLSDLDSLGQTLALLRDVGLA